MKTLLVVDGSPYSDMATKMVEALHLPPRIEVTVLTVIPEHTFLGGITLRKLRGTSVDKEAQQQNALELLRNQVQTLSTHILNVDSVVRWGDPAEEIMKISNESGASLLVMGAKGLTDPLTFRLGSVAQTVMKHAKASVLIVREKPASTNQVRYTRKETATIERVLLATDGSKHSDIVIRFLMALPLPQQTEVIVVTALQSHLTTWMKTPTLNLKTNQELLASLQITEENEALRLTAEGEKLFQTKGYKTASMVLKGEAAESILTAAREHKPDIIALGSRGFSGIESLLLGNVAEKVARYADCSVLIGRAPR